MKGSTVITAIVIILVIVLFVLWYRSTHTTVSAPDAPAPSSAAAPAPAGSQYGPSTGFVPPTSSGTTGTNFVLPATITVNPTPYPSLISNPIIQQYMHVPVVGAPQLSPIQQMYNGLSETARLMLDLNNRKLRNTGYALFEDYKWLKVTPPTKAERKEITDYLNAYAREATNKTTSTSFFTFVTASWPSNSKIATLDYTIRETAKQTILSDFQTWQTHHSTTPTNSVNGELKAAHFFG